MAKIYLLQLPSQGSLFRWMMIKFLFLDILPVLVCTTTVYLNSCENCVARPKYEVHSDFGYLVRLDPVVPSCQWDCTVRIQSTKNDSWLCLSQFGLLSQLNDSNAQLFVHDALREELVHLRYYPDKWSKQEICRKTHFMEFSLRKVNPNVELNLGRLRVQLKVVDIESKNRSVYFEDSYCGTEYLLLNSQVSLYNRPGEEDQVTYSQKLMSACGISVKMVEVDPDSNKRICLLYIPSAHVNCTSNWKFSVSGAGYSLNPADMIHTLKCSDAKARRKHVWCDNRGGHTVTLLLQRDRNVARSTEDPKMFRIVFLDYNGTEDSLLQEEKTSITEMVSQSEDGKSSDTTSTIVVAVLVPVLFLLIVLIIATLVFVRRKKQPCATYWPVRTNSKGSPSKPQEV